MKWGEHIVGRVSQTNWLAQLAKLAKVPSLSWRVWCGVSRGKTTGVSIALFNSSLFEIIEVFVCLHIQDTIRV